MAAQKPSARKTRRAPGPPEDRPEHTFSILLEDVHSKLSALAEGQTMMRESLERRIDGLDGRMDGLVQRVDIGFAEQGGRISRLESAVLTHSDEIRKLTTRVGAVEAKLDTKADGSRIDALDARVSARDR